MAQKQQIIIGYHRQGKSQRAIALEIGISRSTVFSVLQRYKQQLGGRSKTLPGEGIIDPPKYDSSKRSRRSLTTQIQQQIDEYLAQNEWKIQKGRSKQQLKAVDIHAALLASGHEIGYTTVCNYVRQAKQKTREVFIRQSYRPGQAVEFDWGEVRLTIDGADKRLMLAVFTSCYSNHRWARLFYRQDMSSFLHAHACYFSFTGAVPAQLVYDNMRVAVAKFTIKNADKEPTEDLLKLSVYYQFDYRFCNARKGNEKGFVERSVEYIRRKSFGLTDEFNSLAQANDHLLQTLLQLNEKPVKGKTETIQSCFEHEIPHMKTAPISPFDAGQLRRLRIDKYSCIKVDTNYYSVPEDWQSKTVEVKIYPGLIKIYGAQNQLLTQHERRHTRFQFYLHLEHYLKTLLTKPGALLGSKSLTQADDNLRDIFFQYFKKDPKPFIELMLFIKQNDFSIQQFQQAVKQCLKICPHQNPCPDKIKLFLQMPKKVVHKVPPDTPLTAQIRQQSKSQLLDIQLLFNPIPV